MDKSELLEHLNEQIYFIEKCIEDYDKNEIEAKRVATHIRTLVHDTSNSVSLLKKLNSKEIMFIDTNAPKNAFANWKFNKVDRTKLCLQCTVNFARNYLQFDKFKF